VIKHRVTVVQMRANDSASHCICNVAGNEFPDMAKSLQVKVTSLHRVVDMLDQ